MKCPSRAALQGISRQLCNASSPGIRDPGRIRSGAVNEDEESDLPREYTWKVPLCECEDRDQAWQMREVLHRAGIESWVEQPGERYAPVIGNLRILVAADQLDQAREIASRPIPQEIIDLSKEPVPEFEAPKCPKCGAGDPVLEGVDPLNTWECEACGHQWTEPVAVVEEKPANAERYSKTRDAISRNQALKSTRPLGSGDLERN